MMDSNANAGGITSDGAEPTEAELNDLQQFIDSGNLEHLDNMGCGSPIRFQNLPSPLDVNHINDCANLDVDCALEFLNDTLETRTGE